MAMDRDRFSNLFAPGLPYARGDMITVHFAGMPPGTSSLLVEFVSPETLERFGGAEAPAKAIDSSLLGEG
jgi:hypothetical protein